MARTIPNSMQLVEELDRVVGIDPLHPIDRSRTDEEAHLLEGLS